MRGIETYSDVGYYMAVANYRTKQVEGSVSQYVIIATYEPVDTGDSEPADEPVVTPPVVTPPVDTPPVPDPNLGTPDVTPIVPPEEMIASSEFSPADQALIGGQTGNPFVDIGNGNVPLGSPGIRGAWSLLSMMFALFAVVAAILLLLSTFFDKRRTLSDEQAMRRSRSALLKMVVCIMSIMIFLLWIILDNFSTPMVWVNNHTLLIGLLFLIDLLMFLAYFAGFEFGRPRAGKELDA
jgi:hypothetical protein